MKKKMRSQIPQLLGHCLVIVLFHFCPESILREQNAGYKHVLFVLRHLNNPRDDTM